MTQLKKFEEKTLTVLLIEDDPEYQLLVQEILASCQDNGPKFRVESVSRLQEGVERSARGDVDVVLLDLSLPDSKGLETVSQASLLSANIPVVILSASDNESLALEAAAEGIQDYLVKSELKRPLLIRAIRYAIERHGLHKKIQETVGELQSANKKLEALILIDPLTGLLNRRGLELVLSHEIAAIRRDDGELFALILDLDDFKKINDTLGHVAGDVALKEVASRIQGALRKTDRAARIGGDEFIVLLSQAHSGEVTRAAERLRLAVTGTPIVLSPGELKLTCSIGLVPVSRDTISLDELVTCADGLLQQSKQQGKNQISFRAPNGRKTREEGALLSDLFETLRRGDRLWVVRQEIVNLETSQPIGYEFLSRLSFEGFEMPDTFFAFSFEKNILNDVDVHCLRRCLARARELSHQFKKHINLFPSTLLSASPEMLLEQFSSLEDKHGYCLEISEQQIIGDPSSLLDLIQALKKEGIMIAMDDVGFGKSCLESLIVLQPDVIKIDKKCVGGIATDPSRLRLLKRLLRTLRTVTFQIVAEGIESREDLEALLDLGIKYGQGFLFGVPA